MKYIEQYLFNNFDKIKINSQNIIIDDVFIALAGRKTHGNKYIKEAIDNGAKYIITDKKPKEFFSKEKVYIVDNTIEYLYKIASKKRILYKGKVIGITGSIGKTSVKENLKYFLSSYFIVSTSIKSYNNYLGVIISLVNLNLQSDFAIFELGTNNFYEIKKLTSLILPSQVIITNIFPTHLENFINTQNIAEEKSDIFNKNYNPKVDLTILPYDNIDEKKIIEKAKNQNISKILTFGSDLNSDLHVNKIIYCDELHSKIYLKFDKQIITFNLNNNNILRINNILICLLIFIYNNINLILFFSLAKNIPLIEGRGLKSSIIIDNKKINLIDESYNASPQTMKMCIDYIDNIQVKKNQKKFLILGEMKELGLNALNFHIELLKYLSKKKLDNIIICGELFRLALKKNGNNAISYMSDIKIILDNIKKRVNTNDIILIKGSNSALTNKLTKKLLDLRGS